MQVNIISVHHQGNYEKEYVLMRVKEECNIGRCILADSTYLSSGRVSNKLRHMFWIPDKKVKRGDLVSVWTKAGDDTTTSNSDGDTIHRFYWGLKSSVWNNEGDSAVLFELNTWQFFKAN
jgi:hypothetical protein